MSFFKYLFFICLVFTNSAYALSEDKPSADLYAQKFLKNSILIKYQAAFKRNIESYNKKRGNIPALIDQQKGANRATLIKTIKSGNIKVFPNIIYKNGVAKIKIGNHLLKFTVGTLFSGYYFLNGKKFYMLNQNVEQQIRGVKKVSSIKRLPSFLDLIITRVHATDKFEHLLLGTLIIMNHQFKDSAWCLFCEDEDLDASRDNFKLVMADVKKRARNCKEGLESEGDYFRLSELDEYATAATDLKHKLSTYFKSLSSQITLSCETLVEQFYKDELVATQKKMPFYRSSIIIQDHKLKNERDYKTYIVKKCQPYTELRNCLVDSSYYGREVFNESREAIGQKRIRRSDSLPKTYKVRSKDI